MLLAPNVALATTVFIDSDCDLAPGKESDSLAQLLARVRDFACPFQAAAFKANKRDFDWLLVVQNPSPNAYTLAIAGRKPFIVVHSALLELLAPAEVQAVLAHELGHLKCDHGVWLTAANVIASGTVSVLTPTTD